MRGGRAGVAVESFRLFARRLGSDDDGCRLFIPGCRLLKPRVFEIDDPDDGVHDAALDRLRRRGRREHIQMMQHHDVGGA